MSNVVDDRVVDMRFDNSNFEKNVSTSINTLDKLKKSLDFSNSEKSLQGLQNSTNGFSTGRIEEALGAIQNRFSTMGIVGMTIIQNLTNAALGAIGNVAKKLSDKIIQGGISRAMNIENAKFQLEGLGIKYTDVFDAIDYAVTNTAYGLDAAAQAASQLAASGLDYKKVIFTHKSDQKELTQMSMALRAVSGVAAQTQSDYAMVARYFQDVANAGMVTGQTLTYMTQVLNLPIRQNLADGLKAIANGSMEASEEVKKAVKSIVKGTEVSADDIDKMVSKKLITFDIFSTIMFGKFGDHAVEANRTILGVTANIAAALAKIGAEFVQPLIEIDGTIVKMFESIRKRLNEIKPLIIPFAQSVTTSIKKIAEIVKGIIDKTNISWIKPFFTGLGKIIEGLSNDLIKVKYAFKAIFPSDTTNRLNSFAESFEKFGKSFARQRDAMSHTEELVTRFKGFFSLLSAAKTILESFLSPFKGFIEGLKESSGFSGTLIDGFTQWATNLDKMLKESQKLKEFSDNLFNAGKTIGETVSTLVMDIVSAVSSMKEGPISFVDNIFDNLITDLGHTLIKVLEILTGKDLTQITNVFDSLVGFFKRAAEILAEVFGNAFDTIKSFITKVGEVFGLIDIDDTALKDLSKNVEEDLTPIEKVLKFIESAFKGFVEILEGLLPVVKGLVDLIITPIKTMMTAIKEFVGGGEFLKKTSGDAPVVLSLVFLMQIFQKIKNIVDDVTVVGRIMSFIQSLGVTLSSFAGKMRKDGVANVVLSIGAAILMFSFAISILCGIDENKLASATATIISLIGFMTLMMKILTGDIFGNKVSFKKENSLTDRIKYVVESFGGLFDAISQNMKLQAIATLIVSMGAAIWLLAKAAKDFGSLDADALKRSVVAIEILIITLTGVIELLSHTLNDKNQAKVQKGLYGLIAMALAIRILASAAKVFGEMDWEELGKAGAAIVVLMAAMAAFAKVLETSSTKMKGIKIQKQSADMIQLGIGLIALSVALKIMASVAKDFAKMNWDELGRAGAAIGALMVALTVFAKVMQNTSTKIDGFSSKKETANMIQLGVGLIALAAALKIMASAARDFADMRWEELGKAGAALGTIMTAVILLSQLTSSKSDGLFKGSKDVQSMVKLGVGLIAIGAAMKIFASAAKDFAMMDWPSLGKAGAALAGILVGLSLFANFTGAGKLMTLSIALGIFSAALLMMVPAIMAFGSLSIGAMIMSLLEIAGVIAVFAGLSYAFKGLLPQMMGLSMALSAFGASLILVGAGLLVLSSGLMASVKTLDMIKDLISGVLQTILGAVLDSVPLFTQILFNIITEFLKSMEEYVPQMVDSILNIIIKVINVLISRIPELAASIKNLVGALVTAFSINISEIDPEQFLMMMAGISTLLLAIAGAAFITQKAMLGVLGISAVLASLVAMFAILKGIGFESGDILAICEGLSMALLSLSASMLIISLIPIPAAAAGIAGFGIVIAGLAGILATLGGLKQIPGFEWIIGEGAQIMAQIGTAIGEFVGNIIGGVAVGVTARMPEIADNLSAFADHLKPFLTTMKQLDSKVVGSVLGLTAIIVALTGAEILDSLTSWFTGGVDFSKFGQQIEEFAPHIVAFANTVKGINGDDVQAAANAGKALAEMASALPNEGGVLGWFMGENDMEEFGKKLVPFGEAIMDFSESVKGLDAGVVENAANAGMAVANLANELPNSGGVVGWFMGENDMDKFGEQLVIFGKKLMAFSVYVAGLDAGVVENAANAGKTVAALANELPNSGGVAGWFAGNNDMDTFGEQLLAFGRSMMEYSDVIKDLNTDIISKTSVAIGTLVALNNDIPSIGGAASLFTGKTDFQTFGENLVGFGMAMTSFSGSLQNVNLEKVPSLVEGTRGLVELARELVNIDSDSLTKFGKNAKAFADKFAAFGTTYVTNFIEQFTNATDQVNAAITTFIQNILNVFEEKKQMFMTSGANLIEYLCKGIRSKTTDAKNAADMISKAITNAFSGLQGKMYTIGVNLVAGITQGLNDKDAIDALVAKLYWLGQLIASAGANATGERSPSKITEEIGRYLVLGLVVGIDRNAELAAEATENMAETAMDAMGAAITKIDDYLTDNMNTEPTITPVLDMSSLEENASRINDLFNRSVGISNVRASSISALGQTNASLQNAQINGVNGNTTFIQNNYSPKALSRVEIYRQTRNQFAQYREAMQ